MLWGDRWIRTKGEGDRLDFPSRTYDPLSVPIRQVSKPFYTSPGVQVTSAKSAADKITSMFKSKKSEYRKTPDNRTSTEYVKERKRYVLEDLSHWLGSRMARDLSV